MEDRIRELCAQAVSEKDNQKLMIILEELRVALREHSIRMREMAREKLIPGMPDPNRRK